jgi:hypothetical protein
MPLDKIEDTEEYAKTIIKDYQITFNAWNVTPEQRDFFFETLSKAVEEIAKSDLVSEEDRNNMSIGEGKLSH